MGPLQPLQRAGDAMAAAALPCAGPGPSSSSAGRASCQVGTGGGQRGGHGSTPGAASCSAPGSRRGSFEEERLSLLELLPRECMARAARYLDVRDILALGAASKALREACRDPQLWAPKLWRDFGIRLANPYAASPKGLYQLVTRTVGRQAPQGVRFLGFYTDGGCDRDDVKRYWVDHMFNSLSYDFYCSMKRANIHCCGFLQPSEAEQDVLRKERREFLTQRCKLAASILFQEGLTVINSWSTEDLDRFVRELLAHCDHGHNAAQYPTQYPIGMLIVADVPSRLRPQEIAKIRAVLDDKLPDPLPATSPADPHAMCTPVAVPSAAGPSRTAVISRVTVSRQGKLTCPVSSGVVFMATLRSPVRGGPVDPDALAAAVGAACRAPLVRQFDDLDSVEEVLALCAARGAAPVARTDNSSGTFVEFGPDAFGEGGRAARVGGPPAGSATPEVRFKPVLWFRFHRRDVAEGDDDSMDDCEKDLLEVPLAWARSGNLTCVKLIACEDLMDQMDDPSENPNVDINFVRFEGAVVDVPVGAIVQ